jgi:glycosyltransferase involved in cell wall biosynthesis
MQENPRLSICVPVYNEAPTLPLILEKLLLLSFSVDFEIVAVDDASTDGSRELLEKYAAASDGSVIVRAHEENRGKAGALSTAFRAARGEILCVQDGDLEYDPKELAGLLLPILRGRADVVFGSRYLPGSRREGGTLLQTLANRFLTTLSNAFTGLRLTDMETCYKVFRREFLGPLPLRARRFAVEPELAARFAVSGARVMERPISHNGRGKGEGKKIGWRDGVEAVRWMVGLHS